LIRDRALRIGVLHDVKAAENPPDPRGIGRARGDSRRSHPPTNPLAKKSGN